MSLFLGLASKTTSAGTGTSLFGTAPAASSTGGASSLFGNNAAAAPASSAPSLFGAKPAAPATGGTSLFGGNTASSQPSSQPAASSGTSLFGSTLGGTQPATNTGASSLFGAKPTATTGNSLFGGSTATQTQPASSNNLFGGAAAATSQSAQPTNGSVFGNDILPSAKYPLSTERQVDPGVSAAQPAYFQALLERGKKRQAQEYISPFGELPSLELGLADISRKVKNIGQGGPSAGARGADARSHYLLSASGVNTNQALRDIDELANSTAGARNTIGELPDYNAYSDVKQGLTTYHVDKFQYLVDNHLKKAQADFDRMIDEQLHDVNWDAHRQRIYEHFGLKKPQGNSDALQQSTRFGRSSARQSRLGGTSTMGQTFGLPGMAKSVIGTPGPRGARITAFADVADKLPEGMRPAPEDRIQRAKQERYCAKVTDLNLARLREAVYPVLKQFAEVEAEPTNEDNSMLINAYKALIDITGEDSTKDTFSDPGTIRERHYANHYLAESNQQGSNIIGKRIIRGSRKFLEKLFYSELETTIAKNPREANIGGVPTAIAKVKGYVRVRASRKELGQDLELLQELNGDYCWPVIFYMLRSGLYHEALEYLEENQAAFRQIDRSFMRYLRSYVTSDEHRLPPDQQTAINNEYSQRQRLAPEDSIDPYRMMCYKVVGRCDLSRRNLDNITNNMNDWIWLQFSLARDYNRVDEFAHEAFGLPELRNSIKEIGDRYFGPNSDIANAPMTFFFMQILAGLFEKAVADLYPHNYVTATHFAIALDYYGLLRVSDISNSEDLFSQTTRQEPQIAFGSMMGLYTRDFRTANATAAIDYLCLICLNKDLPGALGKSQRELCHQAITEVVLETREYASLLGDIRNDGQRIVGEIETRLRLIDIGTQEDFLRQITLVAARTADEQGRVTDAALLFHLAEDYDKVVQVINEAVSLALTADPNEQPMRLDPLKPRSVPEDQAAKHLPGELQNSLSLTAIDDPFVLTHGLMQLYQGNAMYFSRIKQTQIDSCSLLMQLAGARQCIQKNQWPEAIDRVTASRILPILANGDMTAIRHLATAFNDMPTVVSRTIGHVMIWTVIACSNQVHHLRSLELQTDATPEAVRRCIVTAKDVMVFAGLIKYKLPARVWETLAKVGGDLGEY
ncbi:Nup93/Nic96-domain-containing protein [Acrodontium crateriforme]|uniref:Nup93/Nic96-domain-containing protein n=1 Tax=Acrodontium crateriforme TaxID=150365 RepID=A0AAQ3M366_9PEZI|nr:Nup93/Nic96-domain-containing protein [Acrodontium crateriforme]